MADASDFARLAVEISAPPERADGLQLSDALNRQVRDLANRLLGSGRAPTGLPRGRRTPRRASMLAIVTGPSGARRATAAAIAGRAGASLLTVDLSRAVSQFIGETEKNLERIFRRAEEIGAVLLFDEADALFGRRSDVADSHDRYANLETGYLLRQLEAFQGLVVLATNRRNDIDSAVVQRGDAVIDLAVP
jgi:SpoVK/Ycf46/Vps4 family AAA+-type ATPase